VLFLRALKVEGGRLDVPANNYRESEVSELMKTVSRAYVRGRFHTYFRLGANHGRSNLLRGAALRRGRRRSCPWRSGRCFNPNAAVARAEALSRKPGNVGAVAFSRTGDPATGDFGDAKVIRKFGEVPDDFSML